MRPAAARVPRAAVCLASTLAALAWTFTAGRDLPPDTFHYHLYAGFAALHDRLATDFFAAGPQSYFNPYAFIPLYLMVDAGLPNVVIGAVFALTGTLVLWLTYELALILHPARTRGADAWVAPLAVALALFNPIVLEQLGSSFDDLPIAIVALAGWLALARAMRSGRPAGALIAGLLMGAAVALKLSNAFVVAAAMPLVFFTGANRGARVRAAAGFGVGVAFAFLVVAGPWAYRLWETFGNPFFPLMNALFQSPDFITAPLKHYRFVPDSLAAGLWRPFEMIVPTSMIHTELRSPDARYALLALLLPGWLALVALRRRPLWGRTDGAAEERRFGVHLAGFALGWSLWLYASGNSRYFIALACVASVLTASLLVRLLPARALAFVGIAFFGIQILQLATSAELRYNVRPWDGPWIETQIAPRFVHEPYLYLSLDTNSQSFLATRLAGASSFINIGGAYALGPGVPGGARAAALIEHQRDRLRLLTQIAFIHADGTPIEPSDTVLNGPLERFGLAVDRSDCAMLRVAGEGAQAVLSGGTSVPDALRQPAYLYTCRVVASGRDLAGYRIRQQEVDRVFEHAEAACPELFDPRGTLSQQSGSVWSRTYFDTDGTLFISRGLLSASFALRGDDAVYLGPASAWAAAPLSLSCGRRDGHPFVTVVHASGPDPAPSAAPQ